jgi:hypothetical protein
MKKWIGIPDIPLAERTSREKSLLDIIDRQQGMINDLVTDIEVLKEGIKRLKNHKGKPRIKPSQMDKDKSNNRDTSKSTKRAGSDKRKKNAELYS